MIRRYRGLNDATAQLYILGIARKIAHTLHALGAKKGWRPSMENKTQEEGWKRLEKAVCDLSEAFHEITPQLVKAADILREIGKYAPIPVEGTVK